MPRRWILLARGLLAAALCLGLLEAGLRAGASVLKARRERRGLEALRKKGDYRILCLGESTTYNGYPSVLEEVLNSRSDGVRFAVIDGGIPAVGTGFILEHLEENLDRYRPDMVITMMGINDELEILSYKSGTGLPLLDSSRVVQLARLAWLRLRAGLGRPLEAFRERPEGQRPAKLVEPRRQEALFQRAWQRRMEEGPASAAALLEKALKASPQPYWIHYELGRLYDAAGRRGSAEAALRKAIALRPDDRDARRELARLCTQQKRFGPAGALYRELIALDPREAGPHLELGQMLILRGDHAEAAAALRRARELAPENPAAVAALAIAAGARGDRAAEGERLRELERMGLTFYNSLVRGRYRELKSILDRRGVRLVCVQYPMLSLAPLKSIFLDQPDAVLVDNERIFREAVAREGYPAYFEDMFAGDFGHCTDKGARLLAENIAETVLRELGLAGAGSDERYWYLDIHDSFFTRKTGAGGRPYYEARRPRAEAAPFPVEKSTGTYRVFIVGGSVASQYGSEPSWTGGRTLRDALERVLPDRDVEVINCGMGGYDSYRESQVLREVLRYGPDLIVIMSGNNETSPEAGRPPRLALLALRLRRWLGLGGPRAAPPASAAAQARPDYLDSFAANLRGMILSARRAGAAVVVCTLPRRLDRPPDTPLPLRDADFFKTWSRAEQLDGAAARDLWRGYLARRPEDDHGRYMLAQRLKRSGDVRGARREFLALSRRCDPTHTNPVLRRVAAELGAPVCDLERIFDSLPYALQGELVFRDHIHWYRYADAVVSDAFARLLSRDGAFGVAPAVPRPDLAEIRGDFLRCLAWAAWNSADVAPLFNEKTLLIFAQLRALDPGRFARLEGLQALLRREVARSIWTRGRAAEFGPRWAWVLAHAAEMHRRDGRPREALSYFDAALRRDPSLELLKLPKAMALRALGRRRESAELLESIADLAPDFPQIRYTLELWGLRPRAPEAGPPPAGPAAPEGTPSAGGEAPAQDPGQEPSQEALLLVALRVAASSRDPGLAQGALAQAEGRRLSPAQAAQVAGIISSQGHPGPALAVIEQVLRRAPRDAKLLNDSGVLKARLGRLREAQADLELAIATDPDLGSAYLTLGAVRSLRGDASGARRAYTDGLSRRLINEDPDLREWLSSSLRGLTPP